MKAIVNAGIGILFAGAALTGLAQDASDQTLIDQAANGRGRAATAAQPAQPEESKDLGQLEQEARADLTLSRVRLQLVLARKELRRNELQQAARRALHVQDLLKELPQSIDLEGGAGVSPAGESYALQADGILMRAQRAGIDLAALRRTLGDDVQAPSEFEDYLDRQVDAARQISRDFDGADTRDVETTLDAETLRQRTLRRQIPDQRGYRPVRETMDVDGVTERTDQNVYHQGYLDHLIRDDEVRHLTDVDESRITPFGFVSYPDDWPQRIAGRKRYEGGMIARSDSRTDDQGREYYTAIYDVHDLIYVPPDFQPPAGFSLFEDLRNTLDRAALRERSFIFGGYAEDLAAGIPLLRFFGGVDDFAYRGAKYSYEREQQIMEMIKQFTEENPNARHIALPPTRPY